MNRFYLISAIMASSIFSLSGCTTQHTNINNSAPSTVLSTPDISHTSHKASAHAPTWSYAGATGPKFWGNLSDSQACRIGQSQSPINITTVTTSHSASPTIHYNQAVNVRVHDNGHTVVFTPTTKNNTMLLGDDRFELKQFHYHIPSEHQIGSKHFPGEIHFVHANQEGNLAVIAVMLQQGGANDELRVLLNGTQLTLENDVTFTANGVDLSALIPSNPTYYHYNGSLTTPPCSEKVQWFIIKSPLDLAEDQLAIMKDLYDGNNRPVRDQGDRTVELLAP